MSNYLLGGLIALFLGAIWVGLNKFGALNEQVYYLGVKVEKLGKQTQGKAVVKNEPESKDQDPADVKAMQERIGKLEADIAALQQTGEKPAKSVEPARPEPKPIVVRKFTNRVDGKTIDAQLVAVDGIKVTIRRIDGQEFTLPIARLTPEDQIYIAEHAASIVPVSAQEGGSKPASDGAKLSVDDLFKQ